MLNNETPGEFIGFLDLIGSYVQWIVDLLKAIYTSESASNAPAGFAALLFFGFAIIIFEAWRRSVFRGKKIAAVTAELRRIQPHEFSAKVDEISTKFESDEVLGHAWREFHETVIRGRPGHDQQIYITRRPSEYFNIYDVNCLNKTLSSLLPTIFVSTGLILTFLGLIIALTTAGSLFSDVGQGTDGLRALLSTAGAKFYTSVAGLLASLIATWIGSHRVRKTDAVLSNLCAEIERLTEFLTSQHLAERSERLAEQMLGQITRLNDELAVDIASKLSEGLPSAMIRQLEPTIEHLSPALKVLENLPDIIAEKLSKALEPALEDIKTAFGKASQAGTSNIEDLVGKMGTQLSDATEKQSQELITQLLEATNSLQKVSDSLASAGDRLSGAINTSQ